LISGKSAGKTRCHILVARTTQGRTADHLSTRRTNAGTCFWSRSKRATAGVQDDKAVSGWLALLGAGLLEVAWALGLKYSDGLTRFWPTAMTGLAIVLSFTLMALALRTLPFGTAYAVWTGIGAVGSIVVGMLLYSEPTDPVRVVCLALIIVGMVGLKLNSPV
jgi:quaternary ammonium compound-resistance protein SugE